MASVLSWIITQGSPEEEVIAISAENVPYAAGNVQRQALGEQREKPRTATNYDTQ